MIVYAMHGCGRKIPIDVHHEEDAYSNPAWCPGCLKRFYPKPPGWQPSEEAIKKRGEAMEKVNQAIKRADEAMEHLKANENKRKN